MISPSKVQHQQHKQPSRDNSDTHSHVRLQKGRKPLEKKSFYLDIKNHGLSANLGAKIKDLGGTVELFLVKSVTLVASDRADKFGHNNCDKRKWGYGSGGSGGPPSLRSVEVPTPIATPPTPFGGEYPLSNSTNIRGQTAQRTKSRTDAMLERALTQPQQCSVDPLNNAQTWGIPIWATKKLQAWLEKIYESLKDNGISKRSTEQSNNTEKSLRVRPFKNSYIKFESFKRDTRPVFLELPLWPKLNFDGDPGTCPFDNRVRDKKVNKEGSVSLLNKEKGKEMTRRPRATATRARRTEQLVAGFCEICRQDYRDLSKHVQSDKHVAFVRNDDNFLSLDKLINAGASVEAFLRANEVGQDCNIFPDGDRSLHTVDLDDDKVNKTSKSDLSNFAVDEIKMVQCNGARRNLNLKLSSPHNLRTRTKHESGHLLRSKGSPWHELQDKSEKFYDKFEGFTIKKRAKGTIWIEEDEQPVKKCSRLDDPKDHLETAKNDEKLSNEKKFDPEDGNLKRVESPEDRVLPKLERNDVAVSHNVGNNGRITNIPHLEKETRTNNEKTNVESNTAKALLASKEENSEDCKNGFNGFERVKPPESFPESQLPGNSNPATCGKKSPIRENSSKNIERKEIEIVCNGVVDGDKEPVVKESKDEKAKLVSRIGKRRGFRGRPRLSVEERLIEDNRAYYKVEVLGNKLRSSTGPWTASTTPNCNAKSVSGEDDTANPTSIATESKKEDEPSSEKPVVVRFKRVRKSELSLLSDEAESFMFGEPKRDDSTSEVSDDDQSSVLPRETESDTDNVNPEQSSRCLTISSSSIVSSSPIKQETCCVEDDSQDSMYMGRARKRRRTQAEALIKDNEDYYKFETPGSRLRFQTTALEGQKEIDGDVRQLTEAQQRDNTLGGETIAVEKLYPSKPSPEVEKMQFSFEAVPRSEPWYQTYQRQDEGAEFWHYFSESDERKPFLLPYEIENFHETLAKICQKNNETRKKNRSRGPNGMGRSPRKSPRCHASTLAIMSTIIRKRETQTMNLSVVEEEPSPRCSSRSRNNTPKPEPKQSTLQLLQNGENSKSDVDCELREIAKSIDDMLCADGNLDPDDSFEAGMIVQQSRESHTPYLPRGPPPDLLELLDNCHEFYNCLENSSCASSECGEGISESPLKRRKRRKNRTGWPGIKMRKKLQSKPLVDPDTEREISSISKKTDDDKRLLKDTKCEDPSGRLRSCPVERIEETSVTRATIVNDEKIVNNRQDSKTLGESCASRVASNECSLNDDSKRSDSKQLKGTEESREPGVSVSTAPVQCETISGSEDSSLKNTAATDNSITNDENHENVCRTDSNAVSPRQLNSSKTLTRKRQRVRDSSTEAIDSRHEIENNDNLYIKSVVDTSIMSRKNYSLSKRRGQTRDETRPSDSRDSELSHDSTRDTIVVVAANATLTRKPARAKKRQRRGTLRTELDYEDENCKKDTYPTSIKSNRTMDNLRGVKRRNNDAVTSETHDTDTMECDVSLDERVSPSLIPTTELQNRRSSIEFQPVVRMMKIDDQVEIDHSILSVTVASNRRLRSSSSPRSNAQPPAKRYKRSKGPFGRWIKNS